MTSADGAFEGSITYEIVRKLAERLGVDETALPPLALAVDTDAINALFDSSVGPADSQVVSLEFIYHDHRIEIRGGGDIQISEAVTSVRSSSSD